MVSEIMHVLCTGNVLLIPTHNHTYTYAHVHTCTHTHTHRSPIDTQMVRVETLIDTHISFTLLLQQYREYYQGIPVESSGQSERV